MKTRRFRTDEVREMFLIHCVDAVEKAMSDPSGEEPETAIRLVLAALDGHCMGLPRFTVLPDRQKDELLTEGGDIGGELESAFCKLLKRRHLRP